MIILSPAICRAARSLVDMTQDQLASAARVSSATIRNFEAGRSTPGINNLSAICTVLERAGVEFIPENGGGAGLRLRKER